MGPDSEQEHAPSGTPTSEHARAAEANVGRGQRENYADDRNLVRRQALFEFTDSARSSGRPAIERIAWTGDERVLDAGCGNGLWTRVLADRFGVHGVGLDLSLGMLSDARRSVGGASSLVGGDVGRLPFFDETFDVILCFWMLYHVEDHRRALREFHRVLRPGGRLLATTNSGTPARLEVVLGDALADVTGRSEVRWVPPLSFSAENGASIMRQVFTSVEQEESVTAFAVPFAEPVLAHVGSMQGPIEIYLDTTLDWEAVTGVTRALVEEIIEREGAFRTEVRSVSFLADK